MEKHLENPCPHCGSEEVVPRGKHFGMYPAGCLYLISLPFAMLHQVSTPMLFRCHQCHREFGRRTIMAKIALGILVSIPILLIALFVHMILG